jgi:hypothetical protein
MNRFDQTVQCANFFFSPYFSDVCRHEDDVDGAGADLEADDDDVHEDETGLRKAAEPRWPQWAEICQNWDNWDNFSGPY